MKEIDQIAQKRCRKLLELAVKTYPTEPTLARRYVKLARKLAQRHRFSLGSRLFCKECDTPWTLGSTVRVRIKSGQRTKTYTCANCGKVKRYPLGIRKRG